MKANKMTKTHLLSALISMLGAFLIMGTAAHAGGVMESLPGTAGTAGGSADGELRIEGAWLSGDTLHAAVRDLSSDELETFGLDLRQYAGTGDEYVSVRAADGSGRMSGEFRFKNPYYAEPGADGNPLTPDGAATVVDNATEHEGKEFFTFETPDGNVFYLIVDRQREDGNVYLLNAVTEYDLSLLAEEGDGRGVSAIPEAPPHVQETPIMPFPAGETQPFTEEDTAFTEDAPVKAKSDTGIIVFLAVAMLVGGGVGYYVKIVRPKQNGGAAYDEGDDEPEDDDLEDDGSRDYEDGEDWGNDADNFDAPDGPDDHGEEEDE